MKKCIYGIRSIFFCFVCYMTTWPMDVPQLKSEDAVARKKNVECIKTFQIFNLKEADRLLIPLENIVPQSIVFTPDATGIIISLHNGQVYFKDINCDRFNAPELITECPDVLGAPMIAVGKTKKDDELVIAIAGNRRNHVPLYKDSHIEQLTSELTLCYKKNSDRTLFPISQKKVLLKSLIQAVGINANGADIVATLERFASEHSSFVIRDLKNNNMNAYWCSAGSWFTNFVMNDDGTQVACADSEGKIWLFDIKRIDSTVKIDAPRIISTNDTIKHINYPSLIKMWYVTDDGEVKSVNMREMLAKGVNDNYICLVTTPASDTHNLIAMDQRPLLSIACWSQHAKKNNGDIFVMREKNIFGDDDGYEIEEMTCSMGLTFGGTYPCINRFGQSVIEKGRLMYVGLKNDYLIGVGINGRMRRWLLTEKCGLSTRKRSKSEGCILCLPRDDKKDVDKKDQKSSIIARRQVSSLDNISSKSVKQQVPSKRKSAPRATTITLPLDRPPKQKKKIDTLSLNEVPNSSGDKNYESSHPVSPRVRSPRDDQSKDSFGMTDYQRGLVKDIMNDFSRKIEGEHYEPKNNDQELQQ